MIYFDHNATTPLDPRVLAAMLPFLERFYGNPSALYRHGRLARTAVDTAREQVAALVGCQASEILFTSGGTEANNLALTGLPSGGGLAISAIEHPAISAPAQRLSGQHPLSLIEVDNNGLISSLAFSQVLAARPKRVSVLWANNETGVLQNIAELAAACRERGIVFHTDAVQALGKVPVDFGCLGADMLSVSSHKIYGPKGCGALVVKKGSAIEPLMVGGGQEYGLRSGTENVAAIVGFGKAAELAKAELAERSRHCLALRKLLEEGLTRLPGLTIFSQHVARLPNTVQFGLAGIDGEMLQMELDKQAIAVSSGSACASGGGQPSPVLLAMGVDAAVAKSAIRASLGIGNTPAEIHQFINVLKKLVCPT